MRSVPCAMMFLLDIPVGSSAQALLVGVRAMSTFPLKLY